MRDNEQAEETETDRADFGWYYVIQYGPNGEDNYAWLYRPDGTQVAVIETRNAIELADLIERLQAERDDYRQAATAEASEVNRLNRRIAKLEEALRRVRKWMNEVPAIGTPGTVAEMQEIDAALQKDGGAE